MFEEVIGNMPRVKRIIFVASYPPRKCGIATFTQDLLLSLKKLLPHIDFEVYAMLESVVSEYDFPPEVTLTIDQNDVRSYEYAAEMVQSQAKSTCIIVQHEYGIHGGEEGRNLLSFLQSVTCPVVTTLHTVIDDPSSELEKLTRSIIMLSRKVVALTEDSLLLCRKQYPEYSDKFVKILHGIHAQPFVLPEEAQKKLGLKDGTTLLTFGLLSRNKGIEYVIKALPRIIEVIPDLRYIIAGSTHPNVIKKEGEQYREELKALVVKLGLRKHVTFVEGYLPLNDVITYIQACDIYVATPLDERQAVSGTLSYALGAGRAVVSSAFKQAKEIVTSEVGRLVTPKNSDDIAAAVIELCSDSQKLVDMYKSSYALTRTMLWSNVADEYIYVLWHAALQHEMLFESLPSMSWSYLEKLTYKRGLLQFAKGSKPLPESGYTLDDNSRALQLVLKAYEQGNMGRDQAFKLAEKYMYIPPLPRGLPRGPGKEGSLRGTLVPLRYNKWHDASHKI
jgi:glycosyltransferase involved in cell wall biosynthesis